MSLDLEDARRRYRFAFNDEDRARLPFYSALLTALENDEQAQVLLAEVKVEQRNPMLILASLHLAALMGHRVLAPIYSLARHGQLDDPSRAAAEVLGVVRDEPDTVRRELHRSTQTNEPGRSAVFQAVIALVATRTQRVINIVDVGTSAGINLYFDQFPVRSHDDDNPLTLVCRDSSSIDRSLPLPHVVARVGVDPSPLDLSIEGDRRWLQACYLAGRATANGPPRRDSLGPSVMADDEDSEGDGAGTIRRRAGTVRRKCADDRGEQLRPRVLHRVRSNGVL